MPDIFDEIAPEQATGGDVFDEIAPESEPLDAARLKRALREQQPSAASQFGDRPGDPDTAFTVALAQDLPADIGTAMHKVGSGIYEGGVAALQHNIEDIAGLSPDTEAQPGLTTEQAIRKYPKAVQAGIQGVRGVVESAPQLGLAMVHPALGAAAFGLTPEGFDPKAAAIAAVLPVVGKYTGAVVEVMAAKAGVTADQALLAFNKLGGASGAAGLIGAERAYAISQLPPEQRDQATIDAAGNVGAMFLLGTLSKHERPPTEAYTGPAKARAAFVANLPGKGKPVEVEAVVKPMEAENVQRPTSNVQRTDVFDEISPEPQAAKPAGETSLTELGKNTPGAAVATPAVPGASPAAESGILANIQQNKLETQRRAEAQAAAKPYTTEQALKDLPAVVADLKAALERNRLAPANVTTENTETQSDDPNTLPPVIPLPEGKQPLTDEDLQPDARKDLRAEGVTPENIEALIAGTKTVQQVVDEQLGITRLGKSVDAKTLIIEENPDGSRTAMFTPEAGPASSSGFNIGQASHEEAIRIAREQGIERIQNILAEHEPNIQANPTDAAPGNGQKVAQTQVLPQTPQGNAPSAVGSVAQQSQEFDRLVKDYGPQAGWATGDEGVYNNQLQTGENLASGIAAKVQASRQMQALRRAALSHAVPPDQRDNYDLETPEGRAKALPVLEAHLRQQFPGDNTIAKRRALQQFGSSEPQAIIPSQQRAGLKQDAAELRRIAAENPGIGEFRNLVVHSTAGRGASAGSPGQLGGNAGRKSRVTAAEQKALRELDRIHGTRTIIVDSPGESIPFNGFKDRNSNVILIHARADKPLLVVAGHELLHHIRLTNPALYEETAAQLWPLLQNTGDFRLRLERRGQGKADAVEELLADFLGDNFGRKEFWDDLRKREPNLFRRLAKIVKEWLDKLIAKLKGENPKTFESEQYFSDLEQARNVVTNALIQAGREAQYRKAGIPADLTTEGTESQRGEFSKPDGGDWFGAPESVEEQRARLKAEAETQKLKKAKDAMQEWAAARLVSTEDTRTQDMFGTPEHRTTRQDSAGQGSLFSKPETGTPEERSARNYILKRLFDEGALTSTVQDALEKLPPKSYQIADIESALWDIGEKRDWREIVEQEGDASHKFESSQDPFVMAAQHHGYTDDVNEAGYVLPDGKMLDFSGKRQGGSPGTRAEDHRQVQYPNRPGDGYEAMQKFIEMGAARIDGNSGAVDLGKSPTSAQLNRIREVGENAGHLVVDLQDGKRKASFETESIEKGVGLIRRFYRGEDLPEHQQLFSKPEWQNIQDQIKQAEADLMQAIRVAGNTDLRLAAGLTVRVARNQKNIAAAKVRELKEQLRTDAGFVEYLMGRTKQLQQELNALKALPKEERDNQKIAEVESEFENLNFHLSEAPKKLVAKIYEAKFMSGDERTEREKAAGSQAAGTPNVQHPTSNAESGEIAPESQAQRIKAAVTHFPATLRQAKRAATDTTQKLANLWSARANRDMMAATFDAAENGGALFGKQAANEVLHALNRNFGAPADRVHARNPVREAALTFVIESGQDETVLAEFREQIRNSDFATTKAGKQALEAIDFAENHWERLQPVAQLYNQITDAQVDHEQAAGVETLHRKGGYVFHLTDVLASHALPDIGSAGSGVSSPFLKTREFATYADAIAAGSVPKSLNAVDLLQRRMSLGQKLINHGAWIDGMYRVVDPKTQQPIVTHTITKVRADGKEYEDAPAGYVKMSYGPQTFAVMRGYDGLFKSLVTPSTIRNSMAGNVLMEAAGGIKHSMLLLDSYHYGRLAFWNAMVRGMGLPGNPFSHKQGLTLLDNTVPEIERMAANGEIPAAWVEDLKESKRQLNLLIANGLNVASVGDNIAPHFVQELPVVGTFNVFLFQKFQRGATAEAALIELRRQIKMNPKTDEATLARRVAKDLNVRFGNLQNQSWIKNKNVADIMRMLFLAPQWNESLIRSELGAVKELGQAPFESVKQRRISIGLLGRAVLTAVIGGFIANQIINYITRGHPTWENPEETDAAKLSAYIPDVVGNGPGYLLNPLTLPAEISELLMKKTERTGDFTQAVKQFGASRLGPLGRIPYTLAVREDELGRKLRTGSEVAEQALSSLIPLPISGGAVYRMGKQLVTGEPEEQYPGQFQRQGFQTFGIKLDSAPSPDQRIKALASEFNREKGVVPAAEFFHGDFSDLDRAALIGNKREMADAMARVLEKKTKADIRKHYERWVLAPFTGQQAREKEFLQTLDAEQREQYQTARRKRKELRDDVLRMLATQR